LSPQPETNDKVELLNSDLDLLCTNLQAQKEKRQNRQYEFDFFYKEDFGGGNCLPNASLMHEKSTSSYLRTSDRAYC
jgi:hypothetical protein